MCRSLSGGLSEVNEVTNTIAQMAAALVPDSATIEFGLGQSAGIRAGYRLPWSLT